jgi:hypothetical protein
MTQNEIIEMAGQHFCRIEYGNGNVHECYEFSFEELERFAKLVAAKATASEREATIKIIKETPFSNWFQADLVEAIKARGEA